MTEEIKKEPKKEPRSVKVKFDSKELDCRIDATHLFGIAVKPEIKDKKFTGVFIGECDAAIAKSLKDAGKAK